jgi:intein/homing endonuclease
MSSEIRNRILESLGMIDESVYDKLKFKAVFMAGGPGCFDGDTEVKTESGYKKIKDILVGDKVWTVNEKTLEKELKPVQELFVYDSAGAEMVEVEFENGEKIICTASHEFFIDNKWIKAIDIQNLL